MAKKKFYTVWVGREVGIFSDWLTCKKQIDAYKGARYKSFSTQFEAEQAFQGEYENFITSKKKTVAPPLINGEVPYILDSIAVDAACSGNPGHMEYQGVYVGNGKRIFHQGIYKKSTNNIGEFLALVHGLAFLKKEESDLPLYTDSRTAMSWVKQKKCKTKLARSAANEDSFLRVEAAEKWLKENTYTTKILKWETAIWGEIPADFGRK